MNDYIPEVINAMKASDTGKRLSWAPLPLVPASPALASPSLGGAQPPGPPPSAEPAPRVSGAVAPARHPSGGAASSRTGGRCRLVRDIDMEDL